MYRGSGVKVYDGLSLQLCQIYLNYIKKNHFVYFARLWSEIFILFYLQSMGRMTSMTWGASLYVAPVVAIWSSSFMTASRVGIPDVSRNSSSVCSRKTTQDDKVCQQQPARDRFLEGWLTPLKAKSKPKMFTKDMMRCTPYSYRLKCLTSQFFKHKFFLFSSSHSFPQIVLIIVSVEDQTGQIV